MSTVALSRPAPKTMEDFLDHGIAKVNDSTGSTCDICLSEFALDDYAVRILDINGCNHVFGHKCITTWLHINNTCPLCRVKLHGSSRPPPVFSDLEDFQDEEPHWLQLDQINPRSTNTSDLTGLGRYTNQEAEPRSRYQAFDLHEGVETRISPPRTQAARQQRNHRITTQISVAREMREEYEAELQGVTDGRILRQRISRLRGEEARLTTQLEENFAVLGASTAGPRIVARFSMSDIEGQEEEQQQSSRRPLAKLKKFSARVAEKLGYGFGK